MNIYFLLHDDARAELSRSHAPSGMPLKDDIVMCGNERDCLAWFRPISPECDLLWVWVAPQKRNTGLGTVFLKNCCVQLFQNHEITEIFCEVRLSNCIAIKLYCCLGFSIEGIRKQYYVDKVTGYREDAYVMKLNMEQSLLYNF